jgi:Pyridoxamine 5'-phosphate oxidase
MGRIYDSLDQPLIDFINAQHLFFVGTAPLARDGHVNVSPKGLDSLRILDSKTVAYVDLTGSGIETVAHVRENGRIILMFCAFDGAPKILRLHGSGEVIEPGHPRFDSLIALFPRYQSSRAVIVVSLNRIADSCGYGIPLYRYEAERTQLAAWAERKGPQGLVEYRAQNNIRSIDGLPGVAIEPLSRKT